MRNEAVFGAKKGVVLEQRTKRFLATKNEAVLGTKKEVVDP
jgi:hypothetical protein